MLEGFVDPIASVQGGIFTVTKQPRVAIDAAVSETAPRGGAWHATEGTSVPAYAPNEVPHFTASAAGHFRRVVSGSGGNARGAFGLQHGTRAMVATWCVQEHPNLEKHVVDFGHQTLEAPYLVACSGLEPKA